MTWRPDNWQTIRHAKDLIEEPFDGRLPTANTCYEAGADAMLEALKKEGLRWDKSTNHPTLKALGEFTTWWPEKGWLVFIPEAESK